MKGHYPPAIPQGANGSVIGCSICVAALVSACGGGGGSGGIASTPAPIASPSPTPAPSPTPTPAAVLPPDRIALKSNDAFVTLAVTETDSLSSSRLVDLVGSKDNEHFTASEPGRRTEIATFSYDPLAGDYAITFPDGASGKLAVKYLNGSAGRPADSTQSTVQGPGGDLGVLLSMIAPSRPEYRFSYSHFGEWVKTVPAEDGSAVQTNGLFVYGIETPTSAVPRSGGAHFSGDIIANSPIDPFEVGGNVQLNFDFGAGTLTGYMHPVHDTDGWYPKFDYDYGRYDFAQTVYSSGSSRYSGSFSKDGSPLPSSWFDGRLTGPNAQELIGRFVVPFSRDQTTGSLTGIWLAKRD